MQNPKDYKYTKQHEWVKLNGDIATVGITNHAQELLTDIVFVELPELETDVEQNGNLGVVESVKSVSDIYSPISGRIMEVNNELETAPELINSSPFDKGWIAKIEINNINEMDDLMASEDYDKLIAGE
ncbi:glycine cleavage system protein GcvH [Candidatus Margulisiibacteriota bacterium]